MERASLQHPLPAEIVKMERDETVCKFCGVSYLIHNEIKALEDKLKAAQDELAFYRGMEEREALLKLQVTALEAQIAAGHSDAESKAQLVASLQESVTKQGTELADMVRAKVDMDQRLTELTHTSEQLRLKHSLYATNLPGIMSQLRAHRTESANIKNLMTAENTVLREGCRQIEDAVKKVLAQKSAELLSLQSRLTDLEQSSMTRDERESRLSDQLAATQTQLGHAHAQLEQLSEVQGRRAQLQGQTEALTVKIRDLESQLEQMQNKVKSVSMERDQLADEIRKQNQETDKLSSEGKQKEQRQNENIARLQRELSDRDRLLQDTRLDLERLRGQMAEQQRAEDEIKRRASASSNKTSELQQALEKVTRDISAMKNEREMMIAAHQTQIEQLRESFKNKVGEMDRWPQKLEQALLKERQKHDAEMKMLEEKLKDNFVMELQIEKQKHQELIKKYSSDSRLLEEQVSRRVSSLSAQHQEQISELHRQLAENKARSRDTENSLHAEIAGLRDTIRGLEAKLGKLDTGAEVKVMELKTLLHSSRTELDQAKRDLSKADDRLDKAKEEIVFLQDTVRKECEERFELTEALSTAKEELLSLKRPPGGYPPTTAWGSSSRSNSANSNSRSNHSNNINGNHSNHKAAAPEPVKPTISAVAAASNTAVNSSSRSEEFSIYRKLASNRPTPPPITGQDPVAASNAPVGFDGERPLTPGKGMKGASVTDNRKRISNLLGRR